MSTPPNKPSLHALIVGINEFAHQRNLQGCVNDSIRFKTYLEEHVTGQFQLEVKHLTNSQGTKENIVIAFEEHLIGSTKSGDTVLFYFSGHGGQETAHDVFKEHEADLLTEGLVCYDSGDGGTTLLADKELRYLMGQLAEKNCDIVSIFDCCHSGDITRDEMLKVDGEDAPVRRLAGFRPARNWEDFIFSKDPRLQDPTALNERQLKELLPLARHIQFAACQDSEFAYEHPTRHYGFFTRCLVDTLKQTGGNISYIELQRAIRIYLKDKNLKQNPKIFAPAKFPQELSKGFLSGAIKQQAVTGNVRFMRPKSKWLLDLGSLHGIKAGQENSLIIFDTDGKTPLVNTIIEKVNFDHSILALTPKAELKKGTTFKAKLSGLMKDELYVKLEGEAKGIKAVQKYAKGHANELKEEQIHIGQESTDKSYRLVAEDGGYLIKSAKSDFDHTLIQKIEGYSADSVEEAIKKFKHISQYNFTKNLQNPQSLKLPPNPLDFTFHVGQEEVHRVNWESGVLELPGNDPKGTRYKLKLTNNSAYPLYVACFYLDTLFMVDTAGLEPKVIMLTPGRSVWVMEGDNIYFELEEFTKAFKLSSESIFFKLIASTTNFDVDIFSLPALQPPLIPDRDQYPEPPGRGLVRKRNGANKPDWISQGFELRLLNG